MPDFTAMHDYAIRHIDITRQPMEIPLNASHPDLNARGNNGQGWSGDITFSEDILLVSSSAILPLLFTGTVSNIPFKLNFTGYRGPGGQAKGWPIFAYSAKTQN